MSTEWFEESQPRTCGPKDEEQKNGDDPLVSVPENDCAPGADNIIQKILNFP